MTHARAQTPAQQRSVSMAGVRQVRAESVPGGAGRELQPLRAQFRADFVERDGKQFRRLEGYASVVERGYDMWDMFGSYQEVIDARAFDATLAVNPDVNFLVNHKGLSMARTQSGTLELSVDATGLRSVAYLNPTRYDVRDLLTAIDDENVTEMSFGFMLDEGEWSQDFSTFRITKVDLNRGDVSAVNYGANPHTSVTARSWEILAALDELPAGAARAALDRLNHRGDLTPAPGPAGKTGRSVSQVDAWLAVVAADPR